MTPTEFRAMALQLPEVRLSSSHSGEVFQVRSITIAMLGALDPLVGWVKLSAKDQGHFLETDPGGFSREAGVLGIQGPHADQAGEGGPGVG
jgi:hypothetical protein